MMLVDINIVALVSIFEMGCIAIRPIVPNTFSVEDLSSSTSKLKQTPPILSTNASFQLLSRSCSLLPLSTLQPFRTSFIEYSEFPNEGISLKLFERLETRHISHARIRQGVSLTDYYDMNTIPIGHGMSGPVFLATHKELCCTYAVKSLQRHNLDYSRELRLVNEVLVYLKLDHPNIAKLCEVYIEDTVIHLVMEFCKGNDLFKRLKIKGTFSEDETRRVTREMLSVISYCHEQHICHRDLKLENWVYSEVDDQSPIKLIDFGVSRIFQPGMVMNSIIGTVDYVSPEMIDGVYDEGCDLWSIGVIVYMLLFGVAPFKGNSPVEIILSIKRCQYTFPSIISSLSPLALSFVSRLLEKDPNERMTAEDAFHHPWMTTERSSGEVELDVTILKKMQHFAFSSAVQKASLGLMALCCICSPDFKQLEQEFRKMDKKNKGKIDIAHLATLLAEKLHLTPDESLVVCHKLDLSEDSAIHYWEFLASTLNITNGHETTLRTLFERFDMDNTGYITLENLRQVLGNSYAGFLVEEIFSLGDKKQNGIIEYEEFLWAFEEQTALQ
ncbi:hypothetical protein IE077_000625 [Cardiosporidium cionae]|uniref:Uncharacterized protein n=1 Tax=Cardiosporidium cionae TaxID=476202 RepID=A0ABQ7J7C3_9APIC|nr:hypothetical protein IE077_000625 [Cardiosporidium cionae]|eukprot:KAF8819885.1 hypothetical protein IE077_000625 [Cardiosporidium cionae]